MRERSALGDGDPLCDALKESVSSVIAAIFSLMGVAEVALGSPPDASLIGFLGSVVSYS